MTVFEVHQPNPVLYPNYYKVIDVVTGSLRDAILSKPIFWSDDRLKHWFFDFKFKDTWVSCHSMNNELSQ